MHPEHELARPKEGPLVLAHRGDHRSAPENTMAAFEAALAANADGVELDVRLSSDDAVVVVHDPHLFRLAGVGVLVARSTLGELRRVDLGRGERVPTLDEALDLVLGAGRVVNVEVKGDVPDRVRAARAVARLLARRSERARTHVVVSTFDPLVAVSLRGARCVAPIALLFDAEHTGAARGALLARVLGVDGIHPHHPIATAETVARAKRRGLFVCVWTVNEAADAQRLARAGVDAIITDDVPRIRRALG
jgi:glycerophosphoryl diester phosphodiesterase